MSQDNKSWEKLLEYKFPLLGENENKYRELKDFIHSTLNKEREELIKKVEGMEHELPKTKCMNLENHTFGSCFQCEKSKGYNQAIDDILTILKENGKN